ncbi:MAG TPA: diphthine synthase [Nitrosopumilaceae archaeon]|nr:diphthine synthase [Nitrosopumilaceae archaeon]
MLWFVGLGISGAESISISTQKLLNQADIVYFEQFTSPISKTDTVKIKKISKSKLKIAKRWMVEDGTEILKNAKKKNVVLLTYGDPYIATTHIELRVRAIQEKIKTQTVHAASSVTSMVGEAGLQYYKIGKIVTIMSELKMMTTPYYIIYKNLIDGNHTLLLLEYNQDSKFFLEPKQALNALLETEKEQKRRVIQSSMFAIIASRVGFKNQSIISGKISSLNKIDYGKPPHTIIIPGKLHFTEYDAIKILTKCYDDPIDNSVNMKKIPKQMIEKYVPMVREALREISPYFKDSKEFQEILENAELYIQDAEKFLEEGKDEVAILSIGYADGLVDSLRMVKGLEPKM